MPQLHRQFFFTSNIMAYDTDAVVVDRNTLFGRLSNMPWEMISLVLDFVSYPSVEFY